MVRAADERPAHLLTGMDAERRAERRGLRVQRRWVVRVRPQQGVEASRSADDLADRYSGRVAAGKFGGEPLAVG